VASSGASQSHDTRKAIAVAKHEVLVSSFASAPLPRSRHVIVFRFSSISANSGRIVAVRSHR
jgi:hypothetical protein